MVEEDLYIAEPTSFWQALNEHFVLLAAMLVEAVHVDAAFGDDDQVLQMIANLADHTARPEELAFQIGQYGSDKGLGGRDIPLVVGEEELEDVSLLVEHGLGQLLLKILGKLLVVL